jgi:amino acid transporter
MSSAREPHPTPTLRRAVGLWESTSLSIGVMAPTLAMSVTGAAAAALIGRAAPLAFAVAAVAVFVVSFGFRRLSSEFASAGSVYAFVGKTLGDRAGFATAWALLGTYLVFPPVSIVGAAIFGQAFLRTTGLAAHPGWFPLALVAWAVIGLLAARGIRPATRSLLTFEVVSVALILALVVVIFVKIALGDAPRGVTASWDVVRLPPAVSASTVALAATSGFLAFAGFESAGSLGEETRQPTRQIPRSILLAVAFGSVFYVVCMVAQSLGFGTGPGGVSAFAHSSAPLGDLARTYVGKPLADVLDLAAVVSAIGAGLGGMIVAARMMFALGRDSRLPLALARVSPRTGVPTTALATELTISLGLLVAFRIEGTTALHTFFYLATIGVLNLLVMYMTTNLAAARHLRHGGTANVVLALLGAATAGYVLYRNVWPAPPEPFDRLPYIVAAWLALGLALALRRVRPRVIVLPGQKGPSEGATGAVRATTSGPTET